MVPPISPEGGLGTRRASCFAQVAPLTERPALLRFLPFLDLKQLRPSDISRDALAALAVTFMSIPQGVAYAMIAGLPPAVGLYAATLPTIVGSLFRSSRFVIAGPTNALSLLVGGAAAALAADLGATPTEVALTLALMVGLFQAGAGLLRLGALVDYISSPVVLGYIAGAGVLIGAGQLHHLTRTQPGTGDLASRLWGWGQGLGEADPLSVGVGLGTLALLLILRRVDRRIPGAIVVMALGIAVTLLFDLNDKGLRVVSDIAPVSASLPPLTMPHFHHLEALVPVALAATVLSLVESSAVARTLASRGGDRLDSSVEFFGQGLSNIAAAFVGGYPVSGSLSRSSLNHAAGASTRLSGVLSGFMVVITLLVAGPIVNYTPIAGLAGLLLLVAWDLIDRERIARAFRTRRGDAVAFVATLLGTWVMPLDKAIYLGVGISVVMFLRRARLLVVRDLVVEKSGRMREVKVDRRGRSARRECSAVRVVHLEGAAFFGAAGELHEALDDAVRDPGIRVLLVRTKRLQGMDFTTAAVFGEVARSLQAQGRHLVMVGMRRETMDILERSGTAAIIGEEFLFPTQDRWFRAMQLALDKALELAGEHDDGGPCPYRVYLEERRSRQDTEEARDAG
ncbi:MAG: SulP family inorganic anion transporter [Alphaproteobacteria bacterium]|nr:SulP family inorganic anion transporter [Alphaproteobacteria bacterium]MCB9797833.1 SulP family inorganic anion transporter [Alphaproteobacteria bacterium]